MMLKEPYFELFAIHSGDLCSRGHHRIRPSGLGSGIDKDRPDYTVYSGELGDRPHLRDPRRAGTPALVDVVTGTWRAPTSATLEDTKPINGPLTINRQLPAHTRRTTTLGIRALSDDQSDLRH